MWTSRVCVMVAVGDFWVTIKVAGIYGGETLRNQPVLPLRALLMRRTAW
jgi:hypothetical protein